MPLFIVQTAIRVHDSVCVEITVRGIVRFVISDRKLVAELEVLDAVRKGHTTLECVTI